MTTRPHEIAVAAVQATPVFLDREATVERLVASVDEAAASGTQLVVFPEAIVPGYPDWVWRVPAWSDRGLYERLWDQAVDVPGPVTAALGSAARRAGAWVAVGVNERVSSGTLYNSLVYLDPDGDVAAVHRKLVPTGGERTVWGCGDASTLAVVDMGFARVGGLLCWENLMPLARAAMYQQGIDILLAPTWDNSDSWPCTLRHIAREGRVFVIGTNTCLHARDIPRSLPCADELYAGDDDDWLSRGNTMIVAPDGTILAGPLTREVRHADRLPRLQHPHHRPASVRPCRPLWTARRLPTVRSKTLRRHTVGVLSGGCGLHGVMGARVCVRCTAPRP